MTDFVPYKLLSSVVLIALISTIIYFSIMNSLIIYKNEWKEEKCTPLNMLYNNVNPETNNDGVFASCVQEKNISIGGEIKTNFDTMLLDIQTTIQDINADTTAFKTLYKDNYDKYISDLSNNMNMITTSNATMKNNTLNTSKNVSDTLRKINTYIDN